MPGILILMFILFLLAIGPYLIYRRLYRLEVEKGNKYPRLIPLLIFAVSYLVIVGVVFFLVLSNLRFQR